MWNYRGVWLILVGYIFYPATWPWRRLWCVWFSHYTASRSLCQYPNGEWSSQCSRGVWYCDHPHKEHCFRCGAERILPPKVRSE